MLVVWGYNEIISSFSAFSFTRRRLDRDVNQSLIIIISIKASRLICAKPYAINDSLLYEQLYSFLIIHCINKLICIRYTLFFFILSTNSWIGLNKISIKPLNYCRLEIIVIKLKNRDSRIIKINSNSIEITRTQFITS